MTHLICINMTISSLLVTTTTSTIHSVMWLMLSFMNTSLLFMSMKMEFIATLLLMIYVGAIAMLFLFTMMILNLSKSESMTPKSHLFPTSSMMSLTLLMQVMSFNTHTHENLNKKTMYMKNSENMETMSNLIYTNHSPWLMLSSSMLLISMMATMTMMLKEDKTTKKQEMFTQMERKSNTWQKPQNSDQS